MTMIVARRPYTPGSLGAQYSSAEIRAQLALLSQSVPPTTGRTVTASTTISAADDVLYCDATGGAITVTLPLAAGSQFLKVWIVKTDSSGNAVTIGGTVSGSVNPTLATQYKTMLVVTNGTAWFTLAAV